MKRIISLILILCLLPLTGCAKKRDFGAAEGDYTLTWKELRDNSYVLYVQTELPEGYEWSVSPTGNVTVEGPNTTKKGMVYYWVKSKEIGTETMILSVASTDGSGFSLFNYEMTFDVDHLRNLSLTQCIGKAVCSQYVIGEGEHTITCRVTPGQLQLVLDNNQWHYSNENSDFHTQTASLNGNPMILVYRENEATVMNSTARMGDEAEAEEAPSAGEIMDAYYAEKDDVLIIECFESNITYTLNLHMDGAGSITVTDWTQGRYSGDHENDGLQVNYDEVTGLTHVTEPEGYVRGDRVGQMETVAERMAALHAENYLPAIALDGITPEELRELGREGLIPDEIVEWAGGTIEEAEAIYTAMLEMDPYELEDFHYYLAMLETDGPKAIGETDPEYAKKEN